LKRFSLEGVYTNMLALLGFVALFPNRPVQVGYDSQKIEASMYASGMPQFQNATPIFDNLDVTIFPASEVADTFDLARRHATVSSLIRFNVPNSGPVKISFLCEFTTTMPASYNSFQATIDKKAINFRAGAQIESEMNTEIVTVNLAKGRHTLTLSYMQPLGLSGYTHIQPTFYYYFGNGPVLDSLHIAFHYTQQEVLDLPTITPGDFQIGYTGAFYKTTNFNPNNAELMFRYYKAEVK